MNMGLGYDSDEGCVLVGVLIVILIGVFYVILVEMVGELGVFLGYVCNVDYMLCVICNYCNVVYGNVDGYEELVVKLLLLDYGNCFDQCLVELVKQVWDEVLLLGEKNGYCNVQVLVIVLIGIIGLVMDCDIIGIEFDFVLVKFKKLVGGGYFKIINWLVFVVLEIFGYGLVQIEEIIVYVVGYGSFGQVFLINYILLIGYGFGQIEIDKIEVVLKIVFDIWFVFNQWILGEDFCKKVLGILDVKLNDLIFDLLCYFGYSKVEIDVVNDYVCGIMIFEGVLYLKEEYYYVFDCVNLCGKKGKWFLFVDSYIYMMVVVQLFILGVILKMINMLNLVMIEDCQKVYELLWLLGVKVNVLYCDGFKLLQLLVVVLVEDDDEVVEVLEIGLN